MEVFKEFEVELSNAGGAAMSQSMKRLCVWFVPMLLKTAVSVIGAPVTAVVWFAVIVQLGKTAGVTMMGVSVVQLAEGLVEFPEAV